MNNVNNFDFEFEDNAKYNTDFAKYLDQHPGYLEFSKDFKVGQILEAVPTKVDYKNEYLELFEKTTKTNMYVSFKDLVTDIKEIKEGNIPSLNLCVTKVTDSNEIYASEKKSFESKFRDELFDNFKNNRPFKVKYTKLINGGFMAMYKDVYEVFVPGSLAGANVILDFKKYLNTERSVMVDNYDKDNNLFIVSFKKYLNKALPYKIKNELNIDKKYTGTLTTNPYDFGMFLEFDDYYTGLLHSSEFQNWSEIKKNYKSGDTIDVYVKEISKKGFQYRIILTTNQLNTNQDLIKWHDMRLALKSRLFDYTLDGNKLNIITDTDPITITIDPSDIHKTNNENSQIKINNVDIFDKTIDFEVTT